jgi:RHS repeat-associated protein
MVEKRSETANSDSRIHGDSLDYTLGYEYAAGYAHRVKRIGTIYYDYDLNGNVTVEHEGESAESNGVPLEHEITEYDNGTKSVGYGWGLGREKDKAKAAGYRREYTWDERNRLQESGDNRYRVQYTYGHEGERIGKYATGVSGNGESETLYFNKMWTWKYDGLMSDRLGRNSKHIYLGETRIVTKTGRNDGSFTGEERVKQYYYHSDHLGSAQMITNYQGEEYERIEHTPYGELWIEKASSVSEVDIPYRFTGKERDAETGLYYYGARYLDPKTSRWLSTDPAVGEYIPGAPVDEEAKKRNGNLPGMGGVFNTVNLHLYHYAGNNPVKYTDPDGRSNSDDLGINELRNTRVLEENDSGRCLYNTLVGAAEDFFGINLTRKQKDELFSELSNGDSPTVKNDGTVMNSEAVLNKTIEKLGKSGEYIASISSEKPKFSGKYNDRIKIYTVRNFNGSHFNLGGSGGKFLWEPLKYNDPKNIRTGEVPQDMIRYIIFTDIRRR